MEVSCLETGSYGLYCHRNRGRQLIGRYVDLIEGKKILLSTEDGGRLGIVQLVNN